MAGTNAAGSGPRTGPPGVFPPGIETFLRPIATYDYAHDFGIPIEDSVINDVPTDLVPLSATKRYGNFATMKAGGNVSQVFESGINEMLPGTSAVDVPSDPENAALAQVGVDYADITGRLTHYDAVPDPIPNVPIYTNQQLGFGGAQRTYNANAMPTRIGAVRIPLASVFEALVAEGQRTFVLMWDAGNIGITNIAENFRDPGGAPFEFYFVRSKENLSDPAGKISPGSVRGSDRVHVYFLEDEGDSISQYSVFAGGASNANENLFSNYTLTTKLNPDGTTVQGTVTLPATVKGGNGVTTDTLVIQDVGNQSEISAVVSRVVHMALNGAEPPAIMPYFFLKRAGDWCQALCLLDKSRSYSVVRAIDTPDTGHPGTITISDLERGGAFVGMITGDRVLVSYLIGAGLNAFYCTRKGGTNWLVLFQNMDEGNVDDAAELLPGGGKYKDLSASIEALSGYVAIASEKATAYGNKVPTTVREFVTYILQLRTVYTAVSKLPSVGLLDKMTATVNEAETAASPRAGVEYVSAIGRLRSVYNNARTMVSAVPEWLTTEGADPPSDNIADSDIDGVLTAIEASRPISRYDNGFVAFQALVTEVKTLADKIGMAPSWAGTVADLSPPAGQPTIRASRASPNGPGMPEITAPGLLVAIWRTAFPPPATGGQRGGATPWNSWHLCQKVYPIKNDDEAIPGDERNSRIRVIGTQLRYPSGFLATVVDDTVIEWDERAVLSEIRDDAYKSMRERLLCLDYIFTRLAHVTNYEPSDFTAWQELERISGLASQLDGGLAGFEATIATVDTMPISDATVDAYIGSFASILEDHEYDSAIRTTFGNRINELTNVLNAGSAAPASAVAAGQGPPVAKVLPPELYIAPPGGEAMDVDIRRRGQKRPREEGELPPAKFGRSAESSGPLVFTGGLRERRPLYPKPKHVGGSAPPPRRGLYAGLRERSGEGTPPSL